MNTKVSLCMIVKNEQDTIGHCLESMHQLVDEIIIVDTGSTDDTISIVQAYTDHIHHFTWVDDFSKARNYAFSKATKDYILWLDADDYMKDEDRQKFILLKETLDPDVDSVTMNYHLAFDEFGNLTSSVRRNRLVKRSRQFQWIGMVHEYLEVGGHILNSDIAVVHRSLRHDSDRNLNIYEKRLATGEALSPRDMYYLANELKDHQQYTRAITYYEKFLMTERGWIEDNISSCGKLADCYHELGDKERALQSTLRSFQYTRPRADFCCRLGFHFLTKEDVQTAIFWYKLATQLESNNDGWGFVNTACSTWLPHLQLCVCYDRTGEYELSYHHNEIARSYRPTDPKIMQNKRYLEDKLGIPKPGIDLGELG